MGLREEINSYPLYKKVILVVGGGLLVSFPLITTLVVLRTTQLQSEARWLSTASSPGSVPGGYPSPACESCQSSCKTDIDCPWQQQCMSTTCQFCVAPLPLTPFPPSPWPVTVVPLTPTPVPECADQCRTNTDCKLGEKCVSVYRGNCYPHYVKSCVTPSPVQATPVPRR